MLDFLTIVGLNVTAGVVAALLATFATAGAKALYDRIRVATIQVGGFEIALRPDNADQALREIEGRLRDLHEHPRVFLSYTHTDVEFARRLAKDLRAEGLEVWIAEEQLRAGDSLSKQIEEAISASQWVILVVSGDSIASAWANRELQYALSAEKERGRTLIIPVMYKGDQLPAQLQDRVFADLWTNYESGLSFLLSSMRHEARHADQSTEGTG